MPEIAIGTRVGRRVIARRSASPTGGEATYRLDCDCGRSLWLNEKTLSLGKYASHCGFNDCHEFAGRVIAVGDRFGALTVISDRRRANHGWRRICRCDCGVELATTELRLFRGKARCLVCNPPRVEREALSYAEEKALHANARAAVAVALERGLLVRPRLCQFCEQPGEIQAHHRDHREPLAVLWLCSACHGLEHRRLRALTG